MCGVDPESEQRWQTYALSLLAFSFVSRAVLYAQLRLQGHLPLNPDGLSGVKPALSFNTAVSFLTNTNWQNYSGESTMSYLTQMAGLAVHNFVSAAAGRGRRGGVDPRARAPAHPDTLGNFWVDLTRTTTRVLLPMAFVFALVLVSQGVVQNFHATQDGDDRRAARPQTLPGGAIASQEAIKEIGQNGGGPYNANSSHPFENPNPITNILEIWMLLAIPFAFPWTFGKMAGDVKQGLAVLGAMFASVAGGRAGRDGVRGPRQQPSSTGSASARRRRRPRPAATSKARRCGSARPTSGLFAASTTGTSTGSVDSMHDSYTPIGGAAPLVNIMLGEVTRAARAPASTGCWSSRCSRCSSRASWSGARPSTSARRSRAAEMKLVVLYILFVPLVILAFTAASRW